MHEDLLQHYNCTDQQAAAQPVSLSDAGGSSAANPDANPQTQLAGPQDNCNCKLLLPQLNSLHEAFKQNQVSHPVSASSQDQQPTRPSHILLQHSLTQQLTKHWPQFKVMHYTGTRFEEQRQLHLPQKHKATVPDSTLLVEMNGLEEQAYNNKASDLSWKPLSWLGTILPSSANNAFDPALWATFVFTTLGLEVLLLPLSPDTITTSLLSAVAKTLHGLS
jgi:hypothetical protein